MVIGLMTTAGARTLNAVTDQAEIASEYRIAVGVLYTLGILDGFPDGTFRPETTVNRAQMTNIIFDMMNGTSAVAPPLLATVFPDVAPGSGAYWARGYIAWAHGEGIVVGFPDGNFRPNEPVTVVQAATMLLRALGYGRMGEYQGTGWAQNASNDALRTGIFNADIVDNFEIMTGAQRQVAAQMVFNTLFANRVTFLDALNVYSPVTNNTRYFGEWRFNLPGGAVGRQVFAAPVNTAPVIVAGPTTGATATLPGIVPFVNLDGTAAPAALDGLRFPVTNSEVGRVVNIYAHNDRILFLDVISTDVVVPAGTAGPARAAALGITNASVLAPNFRGQDVMVVRDGSLLQNPIQRVDVAPIDVAILSSTGYNTGLLSHSEQTWVLFNDGTRTAFRTVLYSGRTVENISAVPGTPASVYIGDELVLRSQVTLTAPLTWAALGADPAVEDAFANPAVRGRWANVERSVRNGVAHFTLTEVQTITGTIEEMRGYIPGVGFRNMEIRFAGSTTMLQYWPPLSPAVAQDRAQNSTRINSIHTTDFDAFLRAGLPFRNTQLWTAYISGVTGHVIAVERFVPTMGANAELVMVVNAGWDFARQVGTATFVRTDGTSVTATTAMPFGVTPVAPSTVVTEQQLHEAMMQMTHRVAWVAEFQGVYFMELLTNENRGGNAVQISPAGLAGNWNGTGVGPVPLSFANAQQANVFTPSFVDGVNITETVRNLTTDTRFIGSNGGTAMFPINDPAGQAWRAAPTMDVIYILDGPTLETVQTVFVVTRTGNLPGGGQGTSVLPPVIPPAPVTLTFVDVTDSSLPKNTYTFAEWSAFTGATPIGLVGTTNPALAGATGTLELTIPGFDPIAGPVTLDASGMMNFGPLNATAVAALQSGTWTATLNLTADNAANPIDLTATAAITFQPNPNPQTVVDIETIYFNESGTGSTYNRTQTLLVTTANMNFTGADLAVTVAPAVAGVTVTPGTFDPLTGTMEIDVEVDGWITVPNQIVITVTPFGNVNFGIVAGTYTITLPR